jgi:sugar/nucleoside kinase (ribokinase family)
VREGEALVFRDWPQKREGLALVDVLKVDTAEAEVLTGQTDVYQAVQKLADYGPKEIMLTRPQGILVYADGEYHQAPFRPRQVRGRTGRGDTSFAGYLGRRLTAGPQEACRFAAAMASLKLEQPGPFRGSMDDVERLLKGVNDA